MEKRNKKNYSFVRNIIKFELFYKMTILFILSPLLRNILYHYLNYVSHGIAFNQDMIGDFLSWHGVLVFILLCGLLVGFIYYEIYVIIQILTLEHLHEKYSLRQVMLKSLVNMKHIPKLSLFISGIYYVLLLPLVHIGYLNSYILLWNIPPFIFGELKLTFGGEILILLIYLLYYGCYVIMIFVPLFMVLKEYKFKHAVISSVGLLKKISLKDKFKIGLWMIVWIGIEKFIWSCLPYQLLKNRDFNFYFLKYFINSTSFRYSALQYIFVIALYTASTIMFIRFMIFLFERYENHFILISDKMIEVETMNHKLMKVKQWLIEYFLEVKTTFLGSRLYTNHKKVVHIVLGILSICIVFGYLHGTILLHEPWVIGHRCTGYKVENSIEALKQANEMNANYAEIDIQLSKDGIPVVFHDSHLSRLSSYKEKVGDLTVEQLHKVELHQNGYVSHIVTLEEMIEIMQKDKMNIGLLIELKPTFSNNIEMARKVAGIIEKHQFLRKVIFMSKDYGSLQELRRLQPSSWIGYCIYGSVGEIDDSIWLMNIDFLAVEQNVVSPSFVDKAISSMIPIYVWTVDNEKNMNQYLHMGVSGLITNHPDVARKAVDKYRQKEYHHYYYEGGGYPRQE